MPVTDAGHIAVVNPIRYRGYYYDTETGFYCDQLTPCIVAVLRLDAPVTVDDRGHVTLEI